MWCVIIASFHHSVFELAHFKGKLIHIALCSVGNFDQISHQGFEAGDSGFKQGDIQCETSLGR
jgi:hypothetical protein